MSQRILKLDVPRRQWGSFVALDTWGFGCWWDKHHHKYSLCSWPSCGKDLKNPYCLCWPNSKFFAAYLMALAENWSPAASGLLLFHLLILHSNGGNPLILFDEINFTSIFFSSITGNLVHFTLSLFINWPKRQEAFFPILKNRNWICVPFRQTKWLRELKQGLCNNLESGDGKGDGREVQKGGDIYIPMADSWCYLAKTSTIL